MKRTFGEKLRDFRKDKEFSKYFNETDLNTNYYKVGPINITKKDFEHLQEIMISANELDKKAPYDKLVYQGK